MNIKLQNNLLKTAIGAIVIPVFLLATAHSFAQVNLNKGLVAYYPFSGNDVDSSGNGNNPSFNNATLATDRFGNAKSAYSFNGNGSYIDIPNSASLQMGTRASISLWVKPNAFYTGTCHGNYMLCKGYEGGGALDALFSDGLYDQNNGLNGCGASLDTSHETFYSSLGGYWRSNFIHTNNWYHIVEICDSTTASIYVNGVLINTNSTTPFAFKTPFDLFLGRYVDINSTPYWLNGTLDDIRIYNRALDSAEVTALYNAPNPGTPNDCANGNNWELVIRSGSAQDSLITYGGVANYKVNDASNTSNLEIDVEAWTDNSQGIPLYNTRALQNFNISQIPTNAVVNSAKLYYYAKTVGASNALNGQPTYGSNNAVLLQKVTTPWNVNTLTWNNEPSSDTDTANQVLLPQSTNSAEDYVVDITNLAQYWVNKPDSNFGFILKMQTENDPYNSMIFENGQATDTTRDARLEICYTVPSTLPVTLKSFTATAITSPYTKIDFATENEVNAASVEIERSYDGNAFVEAGSLSAKGKASLNQYSYTDKIDASATKVYYRLKLIDKNGNYKYSELVSVSLGIVKPLTVEVFPNPVSSSTLNMNLYLLKDEALTIRVFDMSGKLVSEQHAQGAKGNSSLSVPAFKSLSSGVYTVSVVSNSDVVNKKVIKVN